MLILIPPATFFFQCELAPPCDHGKEPEIVGEG